MSMEYIASISVQKKKNPKNQLNMTNLLKIVLQHTIGKDCLLPMKFHIQSFLWPF
jgi:hypothetical protein